MIFAGEEPGVVDQELADVLAPEGKDGAGVILIGEIEAIVGIGACGAVEEVHGLILSLHVAGGVVVDHIQDHSDSVVMADVDQGLQLINADGEGLASQG